MDKLKKQLLTEQERGSERFELFGIKLPTELISTWGILTLLVIHLYFWLHLQLLSKQMLDCKNNEFGLQAPWIALYPEIIARAVFLLSVIGMPLGIVVYISYKAWHEYTDIIRELIIIVILIGFCITLSLATLITVLRLWRVIDKET